MENLRILQVKVIDSSTIEVSFTHPLNKSISISNITFEPKNSSTPEPQVLSVKVKNNTLRIKTTPLTYLGSYYVVFNSTNSITFSSLNNDAILLEDNINNKKLFLGPQEASNPSRLYFESYFAKNIYDLEDKTKTVSKYIDGLSGIFSRALYDIGQLRSDNYISKSIVDENIIRSGGPFDRLAEEGAYEVYRVARTKTGTSATKTISYDIFPSSPITLGKTSSSENLTLDSENTVGKFNINDLTLNMAYSPITKLVSVRFVYSTIPLYYDYDISQYGYRLKSQKYDDEYAFSLDTLEINQIRLNDKILEDELFSFDNLVRVEVSYEYNDLGIVVDKDTVSVFTTLNSNRETIPPITNIFDLKHAPIVDANGNVPSTGGVEFIDPNSFGETPHPAFMYEIPYRVEALPHIAGQYSVDYSSGRVYVYGEDSVNDGTGAYPPLATYSYKYNYVKDIDFAYDNNPDSVEVENDFVALPNGSLLDNDGSITFSYEKVLVPNVDYVAHVHTEVLSERVENRLVSPTVIKTKNFPITDVYRVYNETSGEIYNIVRWNDDKIYISYNTPPTISDALRERVLFNPIVNELLFVNNSLVNTNTITVFKLLLKNNNIVSSTEDCIGSSLNSSISFSDTDIFSSEIWYDSNLTDQQNYDRLASVGQYCVDYYNGVVYVAVGGSQDYDIGSCTYKHNQIVPSRNYLINVQDIYYNIDLLGIKNKIFEYVLTSDGLVSVSGLDFSDERYMNDDEEYQLYNSKIGVFTDTTFTNGVANSVKNLRGVYEYNDVLNNKAPINFADSSTFDGNIITVNQLSKEYYSTINDDISITSEQPIYYLSPNITIDISITRLSDNAELWDNSGSITTGDNTKFVLSGVNSPAANEIVKVSITFTINELSSTIVDYNKGDLYIDYTYLGDEIILSYEYGDNVIDFRESTTLTEGDEYFVSYKVGALRDGLLNNFGTLINIPELLNFDISLDRERYRDAVYAALSSFVKGPTIEAIKNIGSSISHIDPNVVESLFSGWTLGESHLTPKSISTTGDFSLLPAKYDNGVLIGSGDQTISMPQVSNLRLEEGTFETWITPQWNGLDNDATISFNILQDGYTIDNKRVFIGQLEYHPTIEGGSFSVDKSSDVLGIPNFNKDGIFIYYDKDDSGLFYRWYVNVVDGYTDGYDLIESNYKIKITSTGSFYDVRSIDGYYDSNQKLTTTTQSITFSITGGFTIEQGITFISDVNHYILDFGEDTTKNRLSIFKDPSGYIVFRIFDRSKTSHTISHDVSGWVAGENHHVAASWQIGNASGRDEMHLFVDGSEVPNIVRHGQKLSTYPHEKFRTIMPEEIVGLASQDIVGSDDLVLTAGSYSVSSSINFNAYNISPGDLLFIYENGFGEDGYVIASVSGQTITLTAPMPYSVDGAKFSINKTDFTVLSEIDLHNNYYVSRLGVIITDNDLSLASGSDVVYSSSNNFETLGVLPGYLIRIDYVGLETVYNILSVDAGQLTLDAEIPSTASGVEYFIYSNEEEELNGVRALRPDYSNYKDGYFNNILTIKNNVLANDLILLRTLGINFKKVKAKHFVWSTDFENVIQTKLPPPVSLDEVSIRKVILDATVINQTTAVYSLGTLTYTNSDVYQPSNSYDGRTLTVEIAGNNTDFTTPADVIISGMNSSFIPVSETVSFSDYGKLDTSNRFISISSVVVQCVPTNPSRTALTVSVKEKYSVIKAENGNMVANINFSYKTKSGTTLEDYLDGYWVRDENRLFSNFDMNGYIVITSPVPVAGFYKIVEISEDLHAVRIEATPASYSLPLSSFSSGEYYVLNIATSRSGFQNGFFIFEQDILKGEGYLLGRGTYEFEYYTYLNMKFDPINVDMFIGSDMYGSNQLNGIIDHTMISDIKLTDKRTGEITSDGEVNITKNFNLVKAPRLNNNHLVYITYDSYPFVNEAKIYRKYADSSTINKPSTINDNFGNSISITNNPVKLMNDGILDFRKEGTIEFWMNPIFDTYNDPNNRYYFDAFGAVSEEVVSIDNTRVEVSGSIGTVLKVSLASKINDTDYFAGGEVEFDYESVIEEQVISTTSNILSISSEAVQIVAVKLIDDLTEQDYFSEGSLASNKKTVYLGKNLPGTNLSVKVYYKPVLNTNGKVNKQVIRLNKKLPSHKTKVIVSYIPKGLVGDRISIYKDTSGMLNFTILASNIDYTIKCPIIFSANSWHRIKASYRFNSGQLTDEMRLWVDGYEIGNVRSGDGLTISQNTYTSSATIIGNGGLITSINFSDPINEINIGSDYMLSNKAFCLMDNFRISNIFRPLYAPYGENIDVNYSSNLDVVYPVTEDLYTTYLSDNNTESELIEDFTTLFNKNNGNFDFYVDVVDSFNIVGENDRVKQILEKLINLLKPANSRAFVSYIK